MRALLTHDVFYSVRSTIVLVDQYIFLVWSSSSTGLDANVRPVDANAVVDSEPSVPSATPFHQGSIQQPSSDSLVQQRRLDRVLDLALQKLVQA